VAGRDHFEGGGHSYQVGADGAEISYFGGRFIAGAEQGGVNAFVERHSEVASLFPRNGAVRSVVGVSQVGKADAEAIVVSSDERVGSLQIDVVADDYERTLLVSQIDTSGGVGEDDGTNSHPAKDAHGEDDFLRGVSLIEVDTALHDGDWSGAGFADHHLSGVTDGGGAREGGNFVEGDWGSFGQRAGKAAEAGAEDETDVGTEWGPLQ
jgi:hypothetical protein